MRLVSLHPKRNERVNGRGATGRAEGSGKAGRREHQHGACVDPWIVGLHFEKESAHQPRQTPRANQADGDAHHHGKQGASENGPEDCRGQSAQRDSNPDLLCSLAHDISHHAVNPHTRNAQTENPEECEQHHVEAPLCHQRIEVVAEGVFVDPCRQGIGELRPDRLPHRGKDSLRAGGCPNNQRRAKDSTLRQWDECLRSPAALGAVMADVSNHADDCTIANQPDDFSDRVLSREIPCGCCLVENDDWLAVLAIGLRKRPTSQQRDLESPEVVRGNLIQGDIGVPWQFPAWNPEIECLEVAAKRQSAAGQ